MEDLSKGNKNMKSISKREALKEKEEDEDEIKLNISCQSLKQEENINPDIPSQLPNQEEKINPNLSRQPGEQEENINQNIPHQPLEQETIPPIPFQSQNANNQSEHKEQEREKLVEPQGIFVYGTLMAEEFLSWVLTGSSENYKTILSLRQPATLRSYRRVAVIHADYPALIAGTEFDKVEGFLVIPSTRSQWKKLDDFEGESYRRQYVQVELSHSRRTVPAFVYLWQDPMDKLLPYQDWSFEYFRENRLEDWLDLFDGMEMVGDS